MIDKKGRNSLRLRPSPFHGAEEGTRPVTKKLMISMGRIGIFA